MKNTASILLTVCVYLHACICIYTCHMHILIDLCNVWFLSLHITPSARAGLGRVAPSSGPALRVRSTVRDPGKSARQRQLRLETFLADIKTLRFHAPI